MNSIPVQMVVDFYEDKRLNNDARYRLLSYCFPHAIYTNKKGRAVMDYSRLTNDEAMIYLRLSLALAIETTGQLLPFDELGIRDGMALPHQLRSLRSAWKLYRDMDDPDDRMLNQWIKKHLGISHVKFLTFHACSNAHGKIAALFFKSSSKRGAS